MKKLIYSLLALLCLGSTTVVLATDYYVAHDGDWGGIPWNPGKEIMAPLGDGTYYRTYFAVPAGSYAGKITLDRSWDSQINYENLDSDLSNISFDATDDDKNIKFTTTSLQNITIWCNPSESKVWLIADDPITKTQVLNGAKVMFYYGSPTGWGHNTMFFSEENKTPNAGSVYETGKSHEWKNGYYATIGLYALNPSTDYYLSNNIEWTGYPKSGLAAGCFADMSDAVTQNTSFVCALSATSYSMTEGDEFIAISATVSGTSGLGLQYQLDHYYYSADGSTWSVLDPENVSGLAEGTYTVKALATDGHIYLVSTNSATLTVSAYVPGAHTISATTATKWTYGSLPASQTAGETVEFTVTPNAGYSVVVSSEDVTIAKDENTYSFTMPDNDVAITVVPTALSYGITYPASPEHYTLDGANPVSGNTDATINITATPDENYILEVTANGNVLEGVANVYSFTMPAEAVTIDVTALAARTFDGSTPLYFNAGAVDWWTDAEAVQKATFTKMDNSEVVVVGVVEDGKIYSFTPAAGTYKSVKFSRHDKDYDTEWNYTGAISLCGTDAYNYIYSFAENSVTVTWMVYEAYTFTAGTTIYYDLTQYGEGINIYNDTWYQSTSEIFGVTLAADWKVRADTKLFRCGAVDWETPVTCATLPTEGQNMIVSEDGINVHWDTYVPVGPVTPPTIQLHANFSGEWANTNAFDDNGENASLTIESLAAGNYEFVLINGAAWISNGAAFTRNNHEHAITAGEGNCTFVADVPGDYTFTWTYGTNTLNITYQEAQVQTYHIYVRNLTTWDKFDVYAWGDNEYLGGWPGKDAADNTTTIDNVTYNVYDFEAVENAIISMYIIFNNEVTDDKDPNYKRHEYQVIEARDYYFTVTNGAAWEGLAGVKRFRPYIPMEHVFGYQYDANGTVGTEWPGVELTPDAEGWYEFIVNKGRTVIFNNGTGEGPMQTGDLAYTDDDPVADECAVWQGENNVSEGKTYMTTSDDCNAAIALTYERGVTNGNYGTICLPYSAIKVAGAELFSIAGKDGEDGTGIYLDEASELLKGVPYIFLANADKLTVYYWGGQSFEESADHLYTTNGLVGFINDGQDYTVTANAHNYILYDNGLYFVDSEAKIASNRAYIDWSKVPVAGPSSAPRRRIGVYNMPTGVNQVPSDQVQSTKVIENGVLYLMYNGTKYNVQGQIVK